MLNGFVKGFGVACGTVVGFYTGVIVANYLAKAFPSNVQTNETNNTDNSNSEVIEEPQ